ncbi:hypothetical protein BJY54_005712 [Streptomyces nodosus]|uniref:Uncharacterized protein n=1 Tax=Streptomyces nodosus TaxID=40318 RepID=A0A0B5DTZ6_9ACTN|nr:hypothetical protein SNOD_29020 [Streptomyces nodosus]MBB4795100.1 hypothetical protein [Streptomyces nodosus]
MKRTPADYAEALPLGEVAAGKGDPLVVHLDEHGDGEAFEGVGDGEVPNDVGPALDLAVDPLQGVGRLDLLPVPIREVRERGLVLLGFQEYGPDLG